MNRWWSLIAAGLAIAARRSRCLRSRKVIRRRRYAWCRRFRGRQRGRRRPAAGGEALRDPASRWSWTTARGVRRDGTEIVMNSPPDGYTLLINTIPFVTNQFLMPRAP